MANYAARAKDWVTDHDLKQKSLAKELHITEAMMSNYLTGKSDIPISVLVAFAKYFDLSMDYLVGLRDDPARPLELSEEERRLVLDFRTLSRNQRELICKNVAIMQEQNRK